MLSDKILRINFDEMICSDFILCAMKSKYVREQIERSATGSSPTMKNISQESIKNYSLPLPPLAEQKEIVARVEKYLQTITQLEIQIATRETTTKQLMQSILKDAFVG
jgi:type I restriction enzyme S subunit